MYGERDDPYAVVSRLARRLEAIIAPEDVLLTIVETVREALKLPYAAIALPRDGNDFEVVATSPARSRQPTCPLVAAMMPCVDVVRICHPVILGTRRPDGGSHELFAPLLFGALCERPP
jgi:hypothetical protein